MPFFIKKDILQPRYRHCEFRLLSALLVVFFCGIYVFAFSPTSVAWGADKAFTKANGARLTQVATASDSLLRNGMESALSSADKNGFGVSAVFEYSALSISAGGDTDLDGGTWLLSMAYNRKESPYIMGVYAEIFNGDYEMDNANGYLKGYGGGLFIHYRERLAEALKTGVPLLWVPGRYLEASARVGYSEMDFNSLLDPPIFAMGKVYYGLSVGGGYVCKSKSGCAMDVYGRLIWTHFPEKIVCDRITYDGADSLRLVAGLRASYLATEKLRPYVGVALDWELLGRLDMTLDGLKADRTDISGLTGLLEAGINYNVSDNIFIDLRVAGSVGKREGIGGQLEIKYRF